MLLQLLRQNDVIAGRQYTSSLLSVVAAAAATEAGCWIFTQGKRQTQRDTATN